MPLIDAAAIITRLGSAFFASLIASSFSFILPPLFTREMSM